MDFLDDLLGEVMVEAAKRPFGQLVKFPFRLTGACIVFGLKRGRNSFSAAYRLEVSIYYGLLLWAVVFLTWFFVMVVL